MEMPSGAIVGTVIIGTLVAAGVWYSGAPEIPEWVPAGAGQREESSDTLPSTCGRRVEWSTDGRKLLILSRNDTDAGGRITLHDLARPNDSTTLFVPGEAIQSASWATDGHVLAGTCQGRLWWIDNGAGQPRALVESPEPQTFSATAIAPGGHRVAAGTSKGTIYICEPNGRSAIRLPNIRESSISDLCFSCDSQLLLSTSHDGTVALWDLKSRALVRELAGHGRWAMAAAFLRTGRQVLSVGLDDTTRVWNTETGHEEWRGEFGLGGVRTLAVSADGRTAAWGGFNRRVVVWDLERHQKQYEIRTAMSMVAHLKFSPDAELLAVAGTEGVVRLYAVHSGAEAFTIPVQIPDR
jgi:WD40 repeat protein